MILHLLKAITLLIWAAFLFWLFFAGQDHLIRLLHPRLWWLVFSGAIIFLLFLVLHISRKPAPQNKNETLLRLPAIVLLSLPLLFFFQAKDARFDQRTFMNRGLQGDHGFIQGGIPKVPGEKRTVQKSEISVMDLIREYDKYQDSEVELVCQTFVDSRLPANLSMCYRYLITCCAADAMPAFIFLRHPETLAITNDAWVKVKGHVALIESQEATVPALEIKTVTYVEEPDFPWVF
jgi:uncharacterized repeat protein (TIGR03943 family)